MDPKSLCFAGWAWHSSAPSYFKNRFPILRFNFFYGRTDGPTRVLIEAPTRSLKIAPLDPKSLCFAGWAWHSSAPSCLCCSYNIFLLTLLQKLIIYTRNVFCRTYYLLVMLVHISAALVHSLADSCWFIQMISHGTPCAYKWFSPYSGSADFSLLQNLLPHKINHQLIVQ